MFEPHLFEQLNCFPTRLSQRSVLDQGRQIGIFKRRELRKQVVKLEDKPDPPIAKLRLFPLQLLEEVLPIIENSTAGGAVQRPDDVK